VGQCPVVKSEKPTIDWQSWVPKVMFLASDDKIHVAGKPGAAAHRNGMLAAAASASAQTNSNFSKVLHFNCAQ
jgi:hypothetical protein